MITVSIKIDRPVKDVWNYFTNASNWSNWYGGEMAHAEWKTGGLISWKMGGPSTITAYEHQKVVALSGTWMDTTYRFAPYGEGTQVTIEEGNPKGGASWSDGGYKHTKDLEASLAKLKTSVESAKSIENTDKISTPVSENIPADNLTEQPVLKERHGCVTTWLILIIIVNSIIAIIYLFASNIITDNLPDVSRTTIVLLGILGVLDVVFSVMLFRWKKLGFWGFVGASIITVIINMSSGLGIGQSLYGLIGIAVLYGVLQIKKDDVSAWENLE